MTITTTILTDWKKAPFTGKFIKQLCFQEYRTARVSIDSMEQLIDSVNISDRKVMKQYTYLSSEQPSAR